MDIRIPSLYLFARKSSDDDCDHSSDNCQKPVNDDSLTIGLGVGIPVIVILLILGFLLYRTYRRNKKEAMERDPDFDETGEATALPDLPNMNQTYQLENPFHNRNSLRYPQSMTMHNKSATSLNKESSDPYLDAIVLPYHHDTGSKASLDMFARQLSEFNNHTPRASGTLTRTRNSSFTNASQFQAPQSNSVSPQKSNLKEGVKLGHSPTKKVGGSTYANIPASAEAATKSEVGSLELVSNSESSGSDSLTRGTRGEKFDLNYENESTASFRSKKDLTGQGTSSNTTTDQSYTWDEKEQNIPQFTFNAPDENLDELNEVLQKDLDVPQPKTVSEREEHSPFNDSQAADTLSQFLLGERLTEVQNGANAANDTTTSAEPVADHSELAVHEKPVRSKSPRISAFNLLQNDSEDEDGDEKILTAEQEEELKRMKSVYKVYFDRENSMKRTGESEPKEFQYDQTQALPVIDPEEMDRLKINNELHTDTNYNKRLTTSSSIYDTSDLSMQDQAYFYQQQQYAQGHYDPNYYGQNYSEQYQGPPPELPQLQQLPPPSDIRKSTIQTYTDFHPRNKNPVSSPKQPFVPIENNGVWTSPTLTSPLMQSLGTFGQQLAGSASTYHDAVTQQGIIPSATQMSRSSVVMLNPVTEITKLRKFRPAGSLPGSAPSPYIPTGFNQSESDLIPNNRKSDVRRMMNTNF